MAISIAPTKTVRPLISPELESAASTFTVSREDIYDYERCPKIVAIKTYRNTRTKKTRPQTDGELRVPIPNIVGQIGETAVRMAFSGGFSEKETNQSP